MDIGHIEEGNQYGILLQRNGEKNPLQKLFNRLKGNAQFLKD